VCNKSMETRSSLLEHLKSSKHTNELPMSFKELWDQPEYFFSTFEDDSMLCLLDDTAYSKDESKIVIIPEQYDLNINDELFQNLKDLKI
jgi:hypothetical protein